MPTDCDNMDSMNNTTLANAQQAKDVYNYKNTKEKLYKTNAVMWCDWHVGLHTCL